MPYVMSKHMLCKSPRARKPRWTRRRVEKKSDELNLPPLQLPLASLPVSCHIDDECVTTNITISYGELDRLLEVAASVVPTTKYITKMHICYRFVGMGLEYDITWDFAKQGKHLRRIRTLIDQMCMSHGG